MDKRKLIVIMNNTLTDEQLSEIKNEFVNVSIEYLPKDFHEIWTKISPEYDRKKIHSLARIGRNYITKYKFDIAIIHGEIGLTYALVNLLEYTNVYCMYPCFSRVPKEIKNPDGTIEVVQILKHVQFRRF